MKRNVIESVLGAVVLIVAGLFLVFAYIGSDVQPVQGYELKAKFNAIDGLTVGSDVRIGGVKIGSVIGQEIDTRDFRAVVTLSILQKCGCRWIRLPALPVRASWAANTSSWSREERRRLSRWNRD